MILTLKSWFDIGGSIKEPLEAYRETKEHKYLEQLITLYSQDLYHFLCSQSHSALAEDICQRTWLTVVEKSHLYRSQQTPKAWLFAIARNALIDEVKKQTRTCSLEDYRGEFDSNAELTAYDHTELYELIYTLPFLQKEALCLQLEGFSLKEISEITQCPIETIKTRIRYAKSQLKHLLGANNERE